MSTGRDWKEFNDAWRIDDPLVQLGRAVYWAAEKLTWPVRHPQTTVEKLEPWGILLAVLGLSITIQIWVEESRARSAETVLRAWTMVTADGPFSGGKAEAAEFLMTRGNDLSGAKFSGARLNGRDLANFDFTKADLSDAFLPDSDLSESDFTGANLSKTILRRANLRRANFRGANLTKAFLREAILANASFSNADLEGADLEQVNLRKAYLKFAKHLAQIQLDVACGDEMTVLPAGMTIQFCSEVDWYKEVKEKR